MTGVIAVKPSSISIANAKTQYGLSFDDRIIVDLFAGGGGASMGLEMGLARPVTVAINHNPSAISMHEANHPHAEHYTCDVWGVHPLDATKGRPVGWLHASPDCTHHSQASGGQPRKKEIRDLSWVVCKWAGITSPQLISLENVMQIRSWGPLIAKRDKATGRVIKLDGTVAAPGERVPVGNQYLVPDPKRKGKTWRRFLATLEGMGYTVEHRLLKACDYGAPTSRERLFLIARKDGLPIVWPEQTHAALPTRRQKRYRTAAECIDWSVPTRSIFGRNRPLATATLKRIAKGIERYVLNSGDPFIVPLRTITAYPKGGAFAVATPVVTPFPSHAADQVTAFLAQMNGGFNQTIGRDMREPMTTVTNTGSQQQLVTASLVQMPGSGDSEVLSGEVSPLSPGAEAGALRVAAFLMQYYSEGGQWGGLDEPANTITTKARLALVTVTIAGAPYVIVDIGLRMLRPRELYRAQGFPDYYIIDRGHDGRALTVTEQVHMCGNSVSPLPMKALALANDPWRALPQKKAA